MGRDNTMIYLDELSPVSSLVGYGELGISGNTGYDNNVVSIKRTHYRHSLSAHPVSEIVFDLGGKWNSLYFGVGFNDSSPNKRYAEFSVYADDILVDHVIVQSKNTGVHYSTCNLYGAHKLRLEMRGNAHGIWVDPKLSSESIDWHRGCFPHLHIKDHSVSVGLDKTTTLMTVLTPNYLEYFEQMIQSFQKYHSELNDIQFAALLFDDDGSCDQMLNKYGVLKYVCSDTMRQSNIGKKLIAHSIPRVCKSQYFIFVDADMLFLKDTIGAIVEAMQITDHNTLFVSKEQGMHDSTTISEAAQWIYETNDDELKALGCTPAMLSDNRIINTGIYGGSRCALLKIESVIKQMPPSTKEWEAHKINSIREQFVTNIAALKINKMAFLKPEVNMQLHSKLESIKKIDDIHKTQANIVHFNGISRALFGNMAQHIQDNNVPYNNYDQFTSMVFKQLHNENAVNINILNLYLALINQMKASTIYELTPTTGLFGFTAAQNSFTAYITVNDMNKGVGAFASMMPPTMQKNTLAIKQDHVQICKAFVDHNFVVAPNGKALSVDDVDVWVCDFASMQANPSFKKTAGKQIEIIMKQLLQFMTPQQSCIVYAPQYILSRMQNELNMVILPTQHKEDNTLAIIRTHDVECN